MRRVTEADVNPLPGVADALHRAAHRAREIAARTRTPLVFSINGKIEKRWVSNDDPVDLREAFDDYLNAVPDTEPPKNDRLT